MSSFKKPGFGLEIPVLGPILHHREVAILENREAGYSQVGYRPSRNQVPGRSFDSRPIGGPDLSRVREAADGKLGCRPSRNQVSDNTPRFLGRFDIIRKGAFTKPSKKPGMWFSDVALRARLICFKANRPMAVSGGVEWDSCREKQGAAVRLPSNQDQGLRVRDPPV